MKDKEFWKYINEHWIFSNKEKEIDNKTAMMYELIKRHNADYKNMFLELFCLFEDYIENVNQK